MSDPRTERAVTETPATSQLDEVGQLIARAGQRPEPPAGDLASIRAAARIEWEEMVAARRARSWFRRSFLPGWAWATAGALVLALVAGGAWRLSGGAIGAPETVAAVELVAGDVRVADPARGARTTVGATAGMLLVAGAQLETSAADEAAYVAIRLVGGSSLRVAAATRIRLLDSSALSLERGTVYLDSGLASGADSGGQPRLASALPSGRGAAMEVRTEFGSVREIGTQFEVRVAERPAAMRIRVREGAVLVDSRSRRAPGSGAVTAAAGDEMTVARDGSMVKTAIAANGADWNWILRSAPPLDIEGRSLRAFLEWVSRETALRIAYEDLALEQAAATIELHGTIEGLTPDEAVQVVLSGSGLNSSVAGGVLSVRRATGLASH